MQPKVIKKKRIALSNLGGDIRCEGDPSLGAVLRKAWQLSEKVSAERAELTHGFHTYAARLAWPLVRHLIEFLKAQPTRSDSRNSALTLLDPFCGSGTVPIEAFASAIKGIGLDINPLTPVLGRVKTRLTTAEDRKHFIASMTDVVRRSLDRVQNRTRIRANLQPRHLSAYDPHVLKELAGLWAEILTIRHSYDREAATMVFSAMVIKFSRFEADTSQICVNKRIRKGLCSEFFLRKAYELAQQWAALAARIPIRAPFPDFFINDARSMHRKIKTQVHGIITSPPYGGTYDYADHHALRCDWLGMDTFKFRRDELGARRDTMRADAIQRWRQDLRAVMSSAQAATRPGGWMFWTIGDAEFQNRPLPMLPLLKSLGAETGWQWKASASQIRGDLAHGDQSRYEHIIAWQKNP